MESIARRLSRRWTTLRTDVSWLGRDFRGEKRPFVVERSGSSRYAKKTARAALNPRALLVTEIVRETADTLSISLSEVDGSALTFEPGQFLTLHLEVDGVPLRRAYSLSSSPLDGPGATITVKRIAGGRASGWLHEHLRPGMTVRALGPSGNFVPNRARELVMIAGGAGITPIVSIAETLLRTRDDVSVHLVYGNRSEADIIFREALERLEQSHDNLSLVHVLETAPDGWTGPTGRLDADVLGTWLDSLPPSEHESRAYYVCGPEPMMHGARELLLSRGVEPHSILEERFRSPEDKSQAALPDKTVTVRILTEGTDHLVPVPPGATLLEAGLAAGAKMPFSCAMGGCAACKCRLVEGEVAMEEPNCLSEEEREAGWILACASRPLGSARVEVE